MQPMNFFFRRHLTPLLVGLMLVLAALACADDVSEPDVPAGPTKVPANTFEGGVSGGITSGGVSAPQGTSLEIINTSGEDVCGIAVDPTGLPEWGDNILDDTLYAGDTLTLDDIETGVYDVVAVNCIGDPAEKLDERYEVEVSGVTVWRIGESFIAGTPGGGGVSGGATGGSGGVTGSGSSASTSGTPGQTWLIMLYQDADDEILEEDIVFDINEAEFIGSSDRVMVVSQLDRYNGGYAGDGNWTSTKRFYLTQDDDFKTINSEEVMDIGEVNMADKSVLVDFVVWAATTYPADNYVLILSDHGTGWPGGWSDPTAAGNGTYAPALAEGFGDMLYLSEFEDALTEIQQQTGIDKFEIIGFDACLMAHIEVFAAVEPYAHYTVASQEVEPGVGWAYAAFLSELTNNPDMTSEELAKHMLKSYIDRDMRVLDDEMRQEFLGLFGIFFSYTPEELARELGADVTMTAIDLSQVRPLISALDNLAITASSQNQKQVASARTFSQSFEDVFGSDTPSYIDLGSFAELLAHQTGSPEMQTAADNMQAALDAMIVAERHGPNRPGATGVSIYFPNSELYQTEYGGSETYTDVSRQFAALSLWDDFLLFHYTGAVMPEKNTGEIAVADRGATYEAPGASESITISDITLSSETIAQGETVTMDVTISGDNIAYVYYFAALYNEEADALYIADVDFIDIDQVIEIGGSFFPDWAAEAVDGVIELSFDWQPLLFYVADSANDENFEASLIQPEKYGATVEDTTYIVEGTYVSAATGETRDAFARFGNKEGALVEVYGYTGEGGGLGAPRQITLQPGDQFIVSDLWFDFATEEFGYFDGDVLVYDGTRWEWFVFDAYPGDYLIGFIVEDFEGNRTLQFTWITITE